MSSIPIPKRIKKQRGDIWLKGTPMKPHTPKANPRLSPTHSTHESPEIRGTLSESQGKQRGIERGGKDGSYLKGTLSALDGTVLALHCRGGTEGHRGTDHSEAQLVDGGVE